jgi:membrane fusion protein (multidrug efflux system)
VSDSSTLRVKVVELGPKVNDAWIITKGIAVGERVAVVGTASLTPNAKIEMVEQKWPAEEVKK